MCSVFAFKPVLFCCCSASPASTMVAKSSMKAVSAEKLIKKVKAMKAMKTAMKAMKKKKGCKSSDSGESSQDLKLSGSIRKLLKGMDEKDIH